MSEVAEAIEAASAAIAGPTPSRTVRVTRAEARLALAMRSLAGPALSAMTAAAIAVLAFGGRLGVWTAQTETVRVHYVGAAALCLCGMIGVLVWRLDGSKLGRLEVRMGPGSITLDEDAGG